MADNTATNKPAIDALAADDVRFVDDTSAAGATKGGTIQQDLDFIEANTTLLVKRADFNANTVLAATTDNTPAAITLSEQTVLGRITSGNIKGLTATEIRTLINVESGADVTDATNVVAALSGATLTGALAMGGQNLTDVHELRTDAIPDTDHTANGLTTNTIAAGATIAIGELCYLGSGGKWLLTDADAEATAAGMLAISVEAQTDTNPMIVALAGSFVRDDTYNWTIGAKLYVGTTPGAIVETAPSGAADVVRVIGYAASADVIYFLPSGSWAEV